MRRTTKMRILLQSQRELQPQAKSTQRQDLTLFSKYYGVFIDLELIIRV